MKSYISDATTFVINNPEVLVFGTRMSCNTMSATCNTVGTNRNFIAGNWYTSYPLDKYLLKVRKLACFGTVRNKEMVAVEF
jgi:hypothetical protein